MFDNTYIDDESFVKSVQQMNYTTNNPFNESIDDLITPVLKDKYGLDWMALDLNKTIGQMVWFIQNFRDERSQSDNEIIVTPKGTYYLNEDKLPINARQLGIIKDGRISHTYDGGNAFYYKGIYLVTSDGKDISLDKNLYTFDNGRIANEVYLELVREHIDCQIEGSTIKVYDMVGKANIIISKYKDTTPSLYSQQKREMGSIRETEMKKTISDDDLF